MKNINEKVIAITGAGSGIGRSLAIQLSQQGSHLSLSDINEAGLAETKNLLSKGVNVSTHLVDVADREQVFAWAADTIKAHKHVDCIINNAGAASVATIEDISFEDKLIAAPCEVSSGDFSKIIAGIPSFKRLQPKVSPAIPPPIIPI